MHPQETRIYFAVLTGMGVLLLLIFFFIWNIVRYHNKKAADHLKKLKGDFNSLDKEKERIAAELHDDLGGSLSAVKLQLQSLVTLTGEDMHIVESAEARIDEIMLKIRSYAFNLVPRALQRKGLNDALKDLIALIMHATNIEIEYIYNMPACSKQTTTHIFRITQEILNNIVKHAEATTVQLSLVENKHKIQLRVCDNGIGFNRNEIEKNANGIGLHNIASRVALLNAKLFLTAAPGKGVDYLIEIPAYDT